MEARLTLKPGQRGTKKLVAEYGARLICVRYRYDPQRCKRFKTVEIIVEETNWKAPRPRVTANTLVGVRVAYAETELRARVKQAGGVWNGARRLWELRYARALDLGLAKRVVMPDLEHD